MFNDRDGNAIYVLFNATCLAGTLLLLSVSLWVAPVDLSARGYCGAWAWCSSPPSSSIR